jgi:N-methylhydantoinase A
MRIGIDVGGTFTDIIGLNEENGEICFAKSSTTPHNLADGVINGIAELLKKVGIAPADITEAHKAIDGIVHGTTIGTNALIERKGTLTGLITTAGFRDVLEIGRVQRPPEALYDFTIDNPPPLVPRYLRLEVKERIGAEGEVVVPFDEQSAREVANALKEQGVKSIAICFLFSFLNDTHEKRMAEIVAEIIPDAYITLSSLISPEFREYERTSTAVLNAYLLPTIRVYLKNLSHRLKCEFKVDDLRIMQASGGSMTVDAAKERAINTVNSGPAGGALAGAFIGSTVDEPKLITVDMGGTSFDIGLVEDGKPKVSSDGDLEGYPAKIPMVNIYAIGAGGGSIARVEPGGILEVGPESASADPGPVCYSRGGVEPTVTDANLILGRLNPDYFLGGDMHLDFECTMKQIKSRIADEMSLSINDAAAGIIRVINAKMAKGITARTTQKGLDLREFSMMAFGGAGALHAVEIANDLGINRVIIPPLAGNLSALGLLVADARHDYTQTIMRCEDEVEAGMIQNMLEDLCKQGKNQLQSEGIPAEDMDFVLSADLRFEGQSYDLNVPFPTTDKLTKQHLDKVVQAFHQLHEHVYAFKAVDEVTEWVNLRVTAIGRSADFVMPEKSFSKSHEVCRIKQKRKVYFFGPGFIEVPIYERDELPAGAELSGPCLIEEIISTTVVPPDWHLKVDEIGNLMIQNI